jgi:RNA polymerase sigma factor (sigma-70 family)
MSERDDQLIAEFNARHSEEAFAALVRQHVNLVFATALRQVGDAGAAEEITQNVFVALAQAAGKLGSHPTIAGWLHRTALNKSREWLRAELRRRKREQAAVNLQIARAEGDSVWSPLVPLLDEALLQLRDADRQAVILHFLEGRNFQEVGSALGVGEDAARKRVNRCLEQLTNFFRRHGLATPALTASAPLFALSTHTAPAGLAASATSTGLAAHSTTSTLTLIKGALKIMAWTKAKTAIVSGVVVLLAAGTTTITIKEIQDHRTYPWQAHEFNYEMLEQAPPQVAILPSKSRAEGGFGTSLSRIMGVGEPAASVVEAAYDWYLLPRIVPLTQLPEGSFDFIASRPGAGTKFLQDEVKRKFGVVARREMRETDVWLLKVKSPNAPGLTPGGDAETKQHIARGEIILVNDSMAHLAYYLENTIRMLPILDRTEIDTGLRPNTNGGPKNGRKSVSELAWELSMPEHSHNIDLRWDDGRMASLTISKT